MTLVQDGLRVSLPRRRTTAARAAKLFDVRADPLEQNDLSHGRPETLERMLHLPAGVRTTTLASDPTAPDTDVEQKLRDLGYIN